MSTTATDEFEGAFDLADEMYVYGVAADDVLNVRSGPGVSNPVVTTLDPGQRGIELSLAREFVGRPDGWVLVRAMDTIGWANQAFLRPVSPVDDPAIFGQAPDGVKQRAAQVVEALSNPDQLLGLTPDAGMRYLDDCNDVILLPGSADAADLGRTVEIFNGICEESTNPVVSDFLQELSGTVGLTSTEAIYYNVSPDIGTLLDESIREQYGDASVVVYHYGGGLCCDGLDWGNLGLVLSNDEDQNLLAIYVDRWSI